MKTPIFNSVQLKKPKTNLFDLSHECKLSGRMGYLVPVFLDEYIPTDRFRINQECLLRFAPLLSPMMERVNVSFHWFAVPQRLLWDSHESFITGGENGHDASVVPQIQLVEAHRQRIGIGSLADYMGIPSPADTPITQAPFINAMPFRAYQLIYNEYFRDQNLAPKVEIAKTSYVSAEEATALLTIRKRAWEKDYFTSALPWAQKGDETGIPTTVNYKSQSDVFNQDGTPANGPLDAVLGKLNTGDPDPVASSRLENIENLEITINDLRTSNAIQKWMEKNARGGSRYIEYILNFFGKESSNKLLQRPQYLGGSKQVVTVSEVLSTFNNTEVPGGEMYGHALSVGRGNTINYNAEEYGYLMCIMSVLPRTSYCQGLPKIYTKFDRHEYFNPMFAHLGEQAVKKYELFMDYTTSDPYQDFGYQSRFAEYKFRNSRIHGDFKDTLSYWTMARMFSGTQSLNQAFVEADPTDRIFAVEDQNVHNIYANIFFNIRAIRPIPIFGTPSL
ncbi:MAG: major capsid protein [Microviridae sp.]|nr:MAG: major capsid protein [Microviridae sp.]